MLQAATCSTSLVPSCLVILDVGTMNEGPIFFPACTYVRTFARESRELKTYRLSSATVDEEQKERHRPELVHEEGKLQTCHDSH